MNNLSRQNSPSLYQQIAGQLRRYIIEGKFKAGEKLPSERELARSFGVSRIPVREALKTLEFIGIVEYVRGDGIYVRTLSMKDLLSHVEFAVQDNVLKTLTDLFEVRESIEVKAAQLAAMCRTDEDIETMQIAVLDMERDVKMGRNHKQSSLDFHNAIFKACNNILLCRINDVLVDLQHLSRQRSSEVPGREEISLDYHRRILEMIREQNAKKAGELMLEHLQYTRNTLGYTK
ncbi:FadR/GntR family transcriptional regulator [Sporomusa aerivorans]|uniref:FadR/GntR family transcriptional regulator n=1 Tax=Sporomusa aerivorans TaxID=204936 RepID=UPI00352AAC0A